MSSSTTPPKTSLPGVEDGKCELLGPSALVVQALMGVMVVLTLVYKRHREKPKRKWRIWMFDVSKQLVGQIVVHFANVLISNLVAHEAVQNPCVLYFLNIVVDTTVGVGILYLMLWGATKVLTEKLHLTGLQSGQYGDGPKPSTKFWARQAAVYVACLLGMKVVVVLLFAVWPGIFDIGEWFLSWTTDDTVQVILVMGICPILFNMLQFWLIDSIVKAKEALILGTPMPRAADEAVAPLFSNDQDSDDEGEETPAAARRRRRSRDLERGVSPLNLSPERGDPPKYEASEGGRGQKVEANETPAVTGSTSAAAVKTRSPPVSPENAGQDPEDDGWSGWDDEADWDGAERAGPLGSRGSTSRSPKAATGRLSLGRTASERAVQLDTINPTAPGAVR